MDFRIAHFTNIAPHYREALWLEILRDSKYKFHFYFSTLSRKGIKNIDFNQSEWKQNKQQFHKLKNIVVFGRLVFQFGVISRVLFKKWDTVILLGDFNILSNWIAAFILRVKGTPILFWGHGMYGDEKGLKKWLRVKFLKLANENLVYGHWAKHHMAEVGFEKDKVSVIYNSLDYKKSVALREKVIKEGYYQKQGFFNESFPVLIFIGRLTPQKRVDWLIKSVKKLNKQAFKVNLIIIGDGPQRTLLEKDAEGMNQVHFMGECYDEDEIGKLIANADLCVSPGNVGLTAIHSLSYGTPVCTHNNFARQMPEFEAIEEGETGCFFDYNEKNIAETIKRWFNLKKDRKEIRKACYQKIDNHYNPQNQVRILRKALNRLIS